MSELTLSAAEIYEITHARWVRKQQAFFEEIGVPSNVRSDGTLHVRRIDYLRVAQDPAQNAPAPAKEWGVRLISSRGE